jgi:hypothetical protein
VSFTGAGTTAADLIGDDVDVLLRFLLSLTILISKEFNFHDILLLDVFSEIRLWHICSAETSNGSWQFKFTRAPLPKGHSSKITQSKSFIFSKYSEKNCNSREYRVQN